MTPCPCQAPKPLVLRAAALEAWHAARPRLAGGLVAGREELTRTCASPGKACQGAGVLVLRGRRCPGFL